MKFGMNLLLWTTHVTEKHYPLLEELKNIGYEGVEISLNQGDVSHYQNVKQELDNLGLECTTVTALPPECNSISADPKVRQAAVDRFKWAIDNSAALGSPVLCGPFHSAFKVFSGELPTEEEKNWSAEVLRQAAEEAEKSNITLAVEFLNRFECYLINTVDDALDLVKRVDHPNCGILYDTHHSNIEVKSITAALEKAKDHIVHVHISENDRGAPGTGQVKWDETFAALKKINYDRWLVIEAFSLDADPEFAKNINVWRNFATREEVYKDGLAFMKKMWQAA